MMTFVKTLKLQNDVKENDDFKNAKIYKIYKDINDIHMYACMYACMYVCMHTCMYVYTHIHTHTHEKPSLCS